MSHPTTSIRQGEAKTVSIGIKRHNNFDQDVDVTFGGAPEGITLRPDHAQIRKSETQTSVTVEAAKDAVLGTHTITVTAKPAGAGKAATDAFDIKVKQP